MLDQTASASANRRIFRSKVDTIRPTYGFEDVSLAPGTSTVEPADVDLSQLFCGLPLDIPEDYQRNKMRCPQCGVMCELPDLGERRPKPVRGEAKPRSAAEPPP